MESAKARGVCSNVKLTAEELEEFREAYKELAQNREGLTRSELTESLLDNHIFSCKREALAFSKLIPRTGRGCITSEALIEASEDVSVHQRRKIQRYIRSLPLPDGDRVRPQSR
jgi:Ca2+-binding EF-hand superfamily protein